MEIIKIGRASDNDVVFNEKEVSRWHCELYDLNGKIFITDRGSTNGTRVNGKKITKPTNLKKGDKVTLGNAVELDWLNTWSKFYGPIEKLEESFETIRMTKEKETQRFDPPQKDSIEVPKEYKPLIDIPSSIHIKEDVYHGEVYKKGDDFQVPFKRKLGSNIGHHVGNTLGCVISALIVAAVIAIIALIAS